MPSTPAKSDKACRDFIFGDKTVTSVGAAEQSFQIRTRKNYWELRGSEGDGGSDNEERVEDEERNPFQPPT
jgi:hypothetical protein